MLPLFVGALFASATLLFCLEPMVARAILPLLGGAPSVWVTCMLFFQAALLAGYAYAHAAVTALGTRRQAAVHLALVLLPFLVLPIAFSAADTESWPPAESPIFRLLFLLTKRIGLPFLVLSTTAPVLQKWFSDAKHESGKDPYFLYAASNLGSMLALAAYPLLIEPSMGLAEQRRAWTYGYGVLVVLVAACAAVLLFRSRAAADAGAGPGAKGAGGRASDAETAGAKGAAARELNDAAATMRAIYSIEERLKEERAPQPITPMRRAGWVVLSFVPSSLLLGVTDYVTTEIVGVPLFWVLPLAIYLGTFILVFARRPPLRHSMILRTSAIPITAAVLIMATGLNHPSWLIVVVHVTMLFFAAMACHGTLAEQRPSADHLTEFYLWISVGGVLGGIFNGIVAPLAFHTILEYPLMITAAALCRTRSLAATSDERRSDVLVPVILFGVTLALIFGARKAGIAGRGADELIFCVPLFANFTALGRPVRFGLGIGAILLASTFYDERIGKVVFADRSFFGELRVSEDTDGLFLQIVHGTTVHGRQFIDPAKKKKPLGYYHPTSAVGQLFTMYAASPPAPSVGVIGLGAGTLGAYAKPSETWTFYEIDPMVVRVAEDTRYFTYLHDAFPDPSKKHIEVGDARLRLKDAPDHGYGILVLDAFSSDAVPAHLLTREALALYESKLAPGALLAAHVSNRHIDLRPVFADLARDAGLVALTRADAHVTDEETADGKMISRWIAVGSPGPALDALLHDARWEKLESDPERRVWTDDYSSLLGVLRL